MRRGVWILATLTIAGCERPEMADEPVVQTVPGEGDESFEVIWLAAQDVLRRNNFRLDRVDRRAGLISTQPETSQHFFEFWRHDVDTPYDFAEASLRTVRRSAEVSLTPAEPGPGWQMGVTVRKEYFATPERQVTSSAAVLRAFGSDLPGVRGEARVRPEDEYWIDAGRDSAMEEWLAAEIASNIP